MAMQEQPSTSSLPYLHAKVSNYNVERSFGAGKGEESKMPDSKGFSKLISLAALCNRATYMEEDADLPVMSRKVRGDATDAALLRFGSLNLNVQVERDSYNLLQYIPFSSKTKLMASFYQPKELAGNLFLQDEGKIVVMAKGAPECLRASSLLSVLFPCCPKQQSLPSSSLLSLLPLP